MKILLLFLYWFLGVLMAVGACCAVGMAINTLIALIKIPSRPQNVVFAVGYLLMAALAVLFVWGGFFLAGWIGDQTDYRGQTGLLVGAIFPGIFALTIIPQFIVVALKQTSGIQVE